MSIAKANTRRTQAHWDALMQSVEMPFAEAISAEKNRFITLVADDFPRTRTIVETSYDYHAASMRALYEHFISIGMRVALNEMRNGIKSVPEDEKWHKLWVYLVRKWVHDHGAARVRLIAETTKEDLQRIITAALALDQEFNPAAVAEQMLRVKELSQYRAETIARTEIHSAMLYASYEGAAQISRDETISLHKKWLPVLDGRTRDNHAAMASHPAIPMNERFNVGGEMLMYPGDPAGSAANTIRCRCVLAYSEASD